ADAVRAAESGVPTEAVLQRDELILQLRSKLAEAEAMSEYAVEESQRLKNEFDSLDDRLDEAKDGLREREGQIQHLLNALDELKIRRGSAGLDATVQTAFGRIILGEGTVSDYLAIVSAAFPEQLLVLPSAIKSAEDAAEFKYPELIGRQLWLLA